MLFSNEISWLLSYSMWNSWLIVICIWNIPNNHEEFCLLKKNIQADQSEGC